MADLSKLRFNGTDYNVKDASAPLRKFTNYSKTGNLPITSDDTTQTAIGKLEKALDSKINTSAKGTASGVAELDANGKVPSYQLPSYVDDVLEYSAKSSFPATGETGKIYVDTSSNKTYRWSGSAYVEISESLALGDTSSTAYRGDRGKAAYDHSQASGNPHGTTGAGVNLTGYSKGSSTAAVAATDTINAAFAKHENRIDANQTNILYAIQTGVKNTFNLLEWCDPGIYSTVNGLNARVMEDGRIHIYGTMTAQNNTDLSVKGSYASTVVVYTTPTSDSYTLSATTEGNVRNSELHFYSKNTGPYDDGINLTSGTDSKTLHAQNYTWLMVRVPATTSAVDFYVTPMVSLTSIGNTDFEPFALPNYDLTRLEAEDRAALAEEIDAGAKNMLNFDLTSLKALNTSGTWSGNSYTKNGVTFTYNDSTKTISTYGTSTSGNVIFYLMNFTPTSGKSFTISGCPSGGSATGYRFCNMGQTWVNDFGSSGTAVGDGTSKEMAIYIQNSGTTVGTSSNPLTWKLMICTKAAFGVSNKFVPYRPNYDLVCQRASGYYITSDTATFAGVLGAAVVAGGFATSATSHSGLCSVSTTTDDEYLLFYWYYSYNVFCKCIPITNKGIAINNMNNQGTVVVTGGTAPYKVSVTVFN